MRVPFAELNTQYLSIKNAIDSAIANVIAESAFIGGKFLKDFEQEFASAYGVSHVIGCGNGTDSLYIIMKMLGIGNEDEVITASNSWISSSESITQAGATKLFTGIVSVELSGRCRPEIQWIGASKWVPVCSLQEKLFQYQPGPRAS